MPSSGILEGLTVFAENTGLVVGRTLVDPSWWRIQVLVSNFSQDTVMVEPFSAVSNIATPMVALTGKDVPFVWDPVCSTAFYTLRDSLIHAPILAFLTETGQYILDIDASNFGLGGVLSEIQGDVECVVAYCSRVFYFCSDVIAPLNGRCWLLWLCVFSSGRIYVALSSLSVRMTLVWLHRFKDT